MKKLILAVVAALVLMFAFAQAQEEKEQPKNREYQLLSSPLQFPASRFIEVGYRELGGEYFVMMSPNRYQKDRVWYLIFSANVGSGKDTVSAQFSFPSKLVVVYLDNSKTQPTVSFGFGRAFVKISRKDYEYGALTVLPPPNNPRHGK